ncbi:MAG: copper transporter [Syntrophomonadaceae bacterium]|jgi:hypothetical protein
MIDLRYHIASLIAVFLSLGLGILIGSTIVGNDIMVDQQQKMINSLEEQFYVLREKEASLMAENEYKSKILGNYENYSQSLLPYLVEDRLMDYKVAIVVSGDNEIPAGMINALSIAGAQVVSKTIILSNLSLDDSELRTRVMEFYDMGEEATVEEMKQQIAASVAAIITNNGSPELIRFLQENGLVKFSGSNTIPVNGIILIGGSNNLANFFAQSFDTALIKHLSETGHRVFGVEHSLVTYSCMTHYQENNISTIDNIDLSPGQISLILAMDGEQGHYGIKETAQKFIPSLPVNSFKGR